MPHNFTDNEKSKMNKYSAKKADFKKRRRDLLRKLEEVEAKIIEMHAKYGAIYNSRIPILTLPVEVTCLIFAFAQLPNSGIEVDNWVVEVEISEEEEEEDDDDDEDDEDEENENEVDEVVVVEKKKKKPMEVVVSHVCRRWRSISLAFPKLWTNFHYKASPTIDARPLQRFDTYAERSAALPLRIWFDFERDRVDPVNAQLVEKAIQHAHRWQHFTMYSDDLTVMQPLDLLRDLPAPMLEYLTLVPGIGVDHDLHNDNDLITSMEPCIFKGGAPKLTFLMLGAHSVYSLPPLSNITILRIEQLEDTRLVFEPTPFIELLSLPSLNQLSLCGNIIQPFHATSIHMPNLKSFRVAELDAIWDLLASIRAPQLDTLVIFRCEFAAGASPPLLDKDYTFPALDKLYLLEMDLEPQIVPALTHMTSQATHVILSDRNIQTILDGGFAGVVWPWLKTLTCNIRTAATIDEYVTFAKNRPKDLITFRVLPCHIENFRVGLGALRAVSLVVSDEWDVDETFWPYDIDENCDYDCFRLDEIYY